MAKRLDIDNGKLLEMIKSGADNKDIMDQFGFKTITQLKNAYANAAMDAGMIPSLAKPGKAAKGDGPSKEIAINKRGSLTLPKALCEDLGFKEGDTFLVRKSRAGVSLKLKD